LVQNAQVSPFDSSPPAPSSPQLSARPATPDDDVFLLALFAESRPELGLLPEPARQQLVELQFRAQRGQYRSDAPEAIDWLLELDRDGAGRPVGRCYLSQGADQHRLLDLAVATEFRGQGLGSAVLRRLCATAAAAGVPLRLSVWQDNAGAIRLYRRLGFRPEDADGDPTGYLGLLWSAEGAQ
jgi:ribosomal protein S18 acetylase RimI-like enzyme